MTATYDHVNNLHKLTEDFYREASYSYVQKFLPDAVMNVMQAELILLLLEDTALLAEEKHAVALAASLVQSAMDTHDHIDSVPVHSEKHRKERQLTVLSGDYYSSLYYSILAERKLIDYINLFSGAVQKINEYKMAALEAENELDTLSLLAEAASCIPAAAAAHTGHGDLIPAFKQLFLLQLLKEEHKDKEMFFSCRLPRSDRSELAGRAFLRLKELPAADGRTQTFMRQEARRLMMMPY
ncbi:heptaprenyl diphosphate synthase component 1 [Alkalicoccus luteus]|uniref:Heptaprenyl diphosphate synthase component 1 n=1 Tax=Alkalicoccus luteus TaxID=1237094 RepID=A0A969TVJ9_9BACI|nr:heptaprenyl diphosphate synthase component 1 [Alkalicoccus luteus]NJP38182.1 heptaprenyl diphosphate synthase component 1 [Alkalicoccus luteus]